MKRNLGFISHFWPLLAVGMICFSFYACGGDDENEKTEDAQNLSVTIDENGNVSDGSACYYDESKDAICINHIFYQVDKTMDTYGYQEEHVALVRGHDYKSADEVPSSLRIYSNITYKGRTYPVRVICDRAFKNCTSISQVVLPQSVKVIGDESFRGCTNLVDLKLPAQLFVLGYDAFRDCIRLPSLELPASVRFVGSGTFQGCKGLTTVVSRIMVPAECRLYGDNNMTAIESFPYSQITLYVPKGTLEEYTKQYEWSLFNVIKEQ